MPRASDRHWTVGQGERIHTRDREKWSRQIRSRETGNRSKCPDRQETASKETAIRTMRERERDGIDNK